MCLLQLSPKLGGNRMLLFWLHIDQKIMISFSYFMDKPRPVFNHSRSKDIFSKIEMANIDIWQLKKGLSKWTLFLIKFAFNIFCFHFKFCFIRKTNTFFPFWIHCNCSQGIYGVPIGFLPQYQWKSAVRIKEKPYIHQRERLCML